MRTLILDVQSLPDFAAEVAETAAAAGLPELHAYPQLLLDDMQLWHREAVQEPSQFLSRASEYKPAIVAFTGPQAAAEAWARWASDLLPKLFVFAHPPAETGVIVEGVLERVWTLRRQRLADRPVQSPETDKLHTDTAQLFGSFPGTSLRSQARERALALVERYQLSDLLSQVDLEGFERGISCLSLLTEALPNLPDNPKALDIGCHLWSYAPFLKAFLKRFGDPELTGVELDPWFLQADGLTRSDWAHHWANLAEARYLEADVRDLLLPPQDLITLFLPIVLPLNAARWGIPAQRHDPADLLDWVSGQLSADGQALIYTGVAQEHEATLALLASLNWKPTGYFGPYKCPLRQRDHGFVIRLKAM